MTVGNSNPLVVISIFVQICSAGNDRIFFFLSRPQLKNIVILEENCNFPEIAKRENEEHDKESTIFFFFLAKLTFPWRTGGPREFFFSVIRHMLKGYTVTQTKANKIVCKCDFQCLIFKLSLRQRFYLFMLA